MTDENWVAIGLPLLILFAWITQKLNITEEMVVLFFCIVIGLACILFIAGSWIYCVFQSIAGLF